MELGNQKTGRCLSTYRGSYTEMFGFVLKTCRKLPSKSMDSPYYSTLALWPNLWTCISLSISLSLSLSHAHRPEQLHACTVHTPTYLAGFQSLRGGGISSLLLSGATPNAACMMVMNFLYFMVKLLWVNLLPWQLWSDLPVRRCFPAA